MITVYMCFVVNARKWKLEWIENKLRIDRGRIGKKILDSIHEGGEN